jgi:PAS domain S-box-containing protein/putative nucleotidyltransferase with HDIG domain
MSGLDLIRKIKELHPATECIMLTGNSSNESAIDAVNIGAYGYMTKPYDIEQLMQMINGAINKHESDEIFRVINDTVNDAIIMADGNSKILYWNKAAEKIFGYSAEKIIGRTLQETIIPKKYQEAHSDCMDKFKNSDDGIVGGKTMEFSAIRKGGTEFPIEMSLSSVKRKGQWQAVSIIRDITERKQAEEKEKIGVEKLKLSLDGIINALALTVEQRDPYTAGHQQRVSKLACAIAGEMGIPVDQIEGIRMAGIIHDIGKMHIPTEILCRPGKLTKDEFNIVRSHAQVGYDILKGIEFPWPVADIVHQHHEKMDGSGYPMGLSNGDILMEARILCVADVVEAMASHRPYRPALGMDMALEEISKGKGIHFDANVVDACLTVIKEKEFVFE